MEIKEVPPKPRPRVECKDCRFFQPIGVDQSGVKTGSCHYNPPTIQGGWPFVHEDKWCGKGERLC